ncbi:AraC family transcriptional regulator [Actinoplanes sp. DH11]|uniref:AraC family transcriptional regulator n=1 Tax=Actinoplanes sp. DH11 TaxID=2857011 RepID=UPI001E2A3FB9|nr:AraC family transcriptional regulator [Actinoplanes sp. DH11]
MEPSLRPTPPAVVAVRTRDLDEARAVCGEHLYPRSMRLLERDAEIDAQFSFLRLGVLAVADVRYGAAVAGVTESLGTYHLNIPQAGRFHASQGGRPISGDTRRAAVYRPDGRTELHYASPDCRLLAVKVDRVALEEHLETAHDVPVGGTIRFASQLDLTGPAGNSCAGLIRFLAAEVADPDSLIHEPMVAEPLEEAVLTALLLAADHQYQDSLQEGSPPIRYAPRSIAAAVDTVHAEPRRAHTVARLAELAGMSSRGLSAEFRRQHGTTPMGYVRRVRLLAAQAELRAAEAGSTTVAAVGRRWGFGAKRFAAEYLTLFHEAPAATLGRDA